VKVKKESEDKSKKVPNEEIISSQPIGSSS